MADMASDRERAALVTIYTNLDVMLLHMARDFLRDAGIETFIFDAETSRMLAFRGRAAVPPRLMVYADRAEEAREVLKELDFNWSRANLLIQALAKARELKSFALDAESRDKAAELVKHAKKSYDRLQALNRASKSNGKGLDKAVLDSTLDDLIETFKDVNKKLDDLLAKAKE
jgi:Putative prokaryotic signal transducing protein